MIDQRLGANVVDRFGNYWQYDSDYDCYTRQSDRFRRTDLYSYLKDLNILPTELCNSQSSMYEQLKQHLKPPQNLNRDMTNKNFLFLISAIYNPRPTTDATGTDTTPDSSIVVPPKYILATSQKHAEALLAREIPSEMVSKIEFIEPIVKQMA